MNGSCCALQLMSPVCFSPEGHSSEHSCTCKETGNEQNPPGEVSTFILSAQTSPAQCSTQSQTCRVGIYSKNTFMGGGNKLFELSVYFVFALPDGQAQVPGKPLLVCHIQHFREGWSLLCALRSVPCLTGTGLALRDTKICLQKSQGEPDPESPQRGYSEILGAEEKKLLQRRKNLLPKGCFNLWR